MNDITLKEVNNIIVNYFEPYQSVIAFAEGAFDPFGYVELSSPDEYVQLGLSKEVAIALFDFPIEAYNIFTEHVRFMPTNPDSFENNTYVLLDSDKQIIEKNTSLLDLINSNSFKTQVLAPNSDEQISALSLIAQEALSAQQSFMDEADYYLDDKEFIAHDDQYLKMASKLYLLPFDTLENIYRKVNPVSQLIDRIRFNEELSTGDRENILSNGTEIKVKSINEVRLTLKQFPIDELDPYFEERIESFNEMQGTRLNENQLIFYIKDFVNEEPIQYDTALLYSISEKGGFPSYKNETSSKSVDFKNVSTVYSIHEKLQNEWSVPLYELGIFSYLDLQGVLNKYQVIQNNSQLPRYFKGEGGSYAILNENDEWFVKHGELSQGFGYKSEDAYTFLKENFTQQNRETIPLYSGEYNDEQTYHTFNSILIDVEEVLSGYDIERTIPEKEKFILVDSTLEVVDWQQPMSYLSERDLEEELEYLLKENPYHDQFSKGKQI